MEIMEIIDCVNARIKDINDTATVKIGNKIGTAVLSRPGGPDEWYLDACIEDIIHHFRRTMEYTTSRSALTIAITPDLSLTFTKETESNRSWTPSVAILSTDFSALRHTVSKRNARDLLTKTYSGMVLYIQDECVASLETGPSHDTVRLEGRNGRVATGTLSTQANGTFNLSVRYTGPGDLAHETDEWRGMDYPHLQNKLKHFVRKSRKLVYKESMQ